MFVLDSHNIVHLAALLQLTGFVFKDQIIMRALLVGGSLTYVLYYLFAPETPLWGGVFWSLVFTLTNLVMIVSVLRDRRIGTLTEDEGRLLAVLEGFSPGEFRRLLAMAERGEAASPMELTRVGQPVSGLHFVSQGKVSVRKANDEKIVDAPLFIGEVAFLLGTPASATVTLAPGAHYLRWDPAQLRRLWLRSPSLRVAFAEALNRDMAAKVAQSSVAI